MIAIDNSRQSRRAKWVIVGQSSAVYVILRQFSTYYRLKRRRYVASFGLQVCTTFVCALCFACTFDLMVSKLFYPMILHYFATRTRHVFQRMFLRSFDPGPVWKVSRGMTKESKCLFRGHCRMTLYATQWLAFSQFPCMHIEYIY